MAFAVEQVLGIAGFWLTLSVTALALWKGGRPKQVAVLVNLLAVLASPLAQPPHDARAPFWTVAAIDTAVLLVLGVLWLASGGRRRWIAAAGGIQLVTVLVHVGAALNAGLLPRGYIAALEMSYFVLLGAFTAGVVETWRTGRSQPIWRRADPLIKPEES